MTEKIMAKHPHPNKSGVRIDKQKYETIREAILQSIRARQEISFKDLTRAVSQLVGDTFLGSVTWYVTTVKLDLEARGIIERIPDRKPQHLRLAGD